MQKCETAKVTKYNQKVRTAASCSLPAIAWLSCLGSQDKAETSDFYIGVHPESLYHLYIVYESEERSLRFGFVLYGQIAGLVKVPSFMHFTVVVIEAAAAAVQ